MQIILPQWILKFILTTHDDLRPLSLFLITEYPAFIVFGFDDKDAIYRDDDMINLGTATICQWQSDIIQAMINIFFKF